MKVLKNVNLDGLKTPMINALPVINNAYAKQGYECCITSGNDGIHMKGSLHYFGLALDFRRKNIPLTIMDRIHKEISSELHEDYDVVLAVNHLHVEYDRKVKPK